ncbi:MAG: hypothetical protein LBC99_02255 [Spirochaetota bacterium]|jgi:hypothetical protein|nr:hypothetical protein [Spirochaetota bacterium]
MAKTEIKPQHEKPGNQKLIALAILVLLLLSAVQFVFLLVIRAEKLPPLDPGTEIALEVVQVIDLKYSFFSETEFQEILDSIKRETKEVLGYEIVFTQVRKVMSDAYADLHNVFIDPKAADAWFSSQLAQEKGWQTNFAWLNAVLQHPVSRGILESFYGMEENAALSTAIKQDFTKKITGNLAIRDLRGSRVFDDKRQEGLSSVAYWHYLLGEQSDGDLVISNIPVFFPSAQTPADAVTRGGLAHSMIVSSARPLGGVIGLSSWPLLARDDYSRETAQNIFSRIALQSIARLLLRQDYSREPEGNLLSPILGENYLLWYTQFSGRLAEDTPQPVKNF